MNIERYGDCNERFIMREDKVFIGEEVLNARDEFVDEYRESLNEWADEYYDEVTQSYRQI